MRPIGRTYTPLTDVQKEAVVLYLNSDLSLDNVADKYEVTKSAIRYWLTKYRKEQNINATNSQGDTRADN